jgi:tetratricopeptide (TPR) repeat protein
MMRLAAFGVVGMLPILTLIPSDHMQSLQSFRDGSRHFAQYSYAEAARDFDAALQWNPAMPEAWFFLANANEALALVSPGIPGAELRDTPVMAYDRALQLGLGEVTGTRELKAIALAALARLETERPEPDAATALAHATRLAREYPDDPRALNTLALTYERLGRAAEAAATYERLAASHPGDAAVCQTRADFFRRRAAERGSDGREALSMFEQCAEANPSDPVGFYTVAAFYWEAGYRDPLSDAATRRTLVQKGMAAVERALALRPGYVDAMLYKALLLRMNAQLTADPQLTRQYGEEAARVMAEARELQARARQ